MSSGVHMFTYLLGIIHEFERKHGRRPQLVCLNTRHMRQFMEECPDLFDRQTAMPLGFRILVLPESELSHPKAVWLPPRKRTKPRAPNGEPLALLAWTNKRQRQTEG